ncbi:hypothetical protein N665_0098s0026 [Sinapis alba]|nr:hypothetical protein N665_0098s0026 [Sinapis alba]
MYSTLDYLLAVRDALDGTPEMAKMMDSCFGGLFKILARRLLMGRVIQGMMTRQVVTKKKYEMWPVFGGKPLRFSLVEFGEVTGLPCGEFEDGYNIDYQIPVKEENYDYWDRLIGSNMDATVEDLVLLIKSDREMSGWGILRLCLLIIVDGVLVATTQKTRPTLKYVKLVENLKKLFTFPWGKRPPPRVMGKCEDPTGDFCKKLRQKTVKTVGFPLALQLVALQAIPQLISLVGGDDSVTEKYDKKVDYMVKLIKEMYVFTKAHWGGGDAGDPALEIQGRGLTVEGHVLKQRRMSAYFKRGTAVDEEIFLKVEAQVEELGREVKRLKGVVEKHATCLKKRRNRKRGRARRSGEKIIRSQGLRKLRVRWMVWIAKKIVGGVGDRPKCTRDDSGSSAEEETILLARLKEGDGVRAEWVEGGTTGAGEKVMYQGATSNTFFVTEDEGGDAVGDNESGVGVWKDVYPLTYVDEAGMDDVCAANEARSERHKPVVDEEELAVVLLSKDQYQVPDIVPFYEDCDYRFFERVLLANINMMHYDAGGYDADNRFFVDLETPQKWVTSTHIGMLMEYNFQRHGFEALRNRAILCISLVDWSILVMDPNPRLKTTEEVDVLMEPLATILPYIAKKVCPASAVGEHHLVLFHVERLTGVYENVQSCDYGSVAVKFMEMHATWDNNPMMVGLTDDLVDIFMKQYAMELYISMIVPLYLR